MGKNRSRNNKKQIKDNATDGVKQAKTAENSSLPQKESPVEQISGADSNIGSTPDSSSVEISPLPAEEQLHVSTSPVATSKSLTSSQKSPNFQVDSIYPTHSKDEIDYYNDAAEQLHTLEHHHHHNLDHPYLESSSHVHSHLAGAPETLEEPANLESPSKQVSNTEATETMIPRVENIPSPKEAEVSSIPEITQPFPEAVLIARNELVEAVEDDAAIASTWRIVEDATVATFSPTTEPSDVITIQYLGKDATTHLKENVEPFCPGESLGEMNTVEWIIVWLESFYQQVNSLLELSTAPSPEVLPPSTHSRRYATTSDATSSSSSSSSSSWRNSFVGMMLLEILKQVVKGQMYLMVLVIKYSLIITLRVLSWFLWWIFLPIQMMTRVIGWWVKVGISALVIALSFLPGKDSLPKAINGSMIGA